MVKEETECTQFRLPRGRQTVAIESPPSGISLLGFHGEDQIYLSRAEDALEREHEQTLKKEQKLAPLFYVLVTASVVLLLSIASVGLCQGLLKT